MHEPTPRPGGNSGRAPTTPSPRTSSAPRPIGVGDYLVTALQLRRHARHGSAIPRCVRERVLPGGFGCLTYLGRNCDQNPTSLGRGHLLGGQNQGTHSSGAGHPPRRLTTRLSAETARPRGGGTPALDDATTRLMWGEVPGWELRHGGRQTAADRKTVQVRRLSRGHGVVIRWWCCEYHPDFCVHYSQVDATRTHVVRGLSENDFILASSLDARMKSFSESHAPRESTA